MSILKSAVVSVPQTTPASLATLLVQTGLCKQIIVKSDGDGSVNPNSTTGLIFIGGTNATGVKYPLRRGEGIVLPLARDGDTETDLSAVFVHSNETGQSLSVIVTD